MTVNGHVTCACLESRTWWKRNHFPERNHLYHLFWSQGQHSPGPSEQCARRAECQTLASQPLNACFCWSCRTASFLLLLLRLPGLERLRFPCRKSPREERQQTRTQLRDRSRKRIFSTKVWLCLKTILWPGFGLYVYLFIFLRNYKPLSGNVKKKLRKYQGRLEDFTETGACLDKGHGEEGSIQFYWEVLA